MRKKKQQKKKNSGFTLIEMMVAVAIFSVVMLVAVGALLSVMDANRKAQALKNVINNINFTLESMSRTVRTGSAYHCKPGKSDTTPVGGDSIDKAKNCKNGGRLLAFEGQDGDPNTKDDQVIYRLNGTKLQRSIQGGKDKSWVSLTSPNVRVEDFAVYVFGAKDSDSVQPRVIITMRVSAVSSNRAETEFNLQTSVTQRFLDI